MSESFFHDIRRAFYKLHRASWEEALVEMVDGLRHSEREDDELGNLGMMLEKVVRWSLAMVVEMVVVPVHEDSAVVRPQYPVA